MTLILKKKIAEFSDRDRREHMSWCLKNNIKVIIEPIDNMYGYVVIYINGIDYHENHTRYKLDNKAMRTKRKKGEPPHQKYSDVIYETYTNLYLEHHERKKDNS